jgi:hypothetical protein
MVPPRSLYPFWSLAAGVALPLRLRALEPLAPVPDHFPMYVGFRESVNVADRPPGASEPEAAIVDGCVRWPCAPAGYVQSVQFPGDPAQRFAIGIPLDIFRPTVLCLRRSALV